MIKIGVVLVVQTNKKTGQYLTCPICKKVFYRKKSAIAKAKDINHLTCSKECCYKLRKELYKGKGNHQYGLKGFKNSSWKSDVRYKNDKRYTMIRALDHPFKNKYGFVPEHILVAEKYLLNENNTIIINNKKYLKPECVVHHIDFNKKNNNYTNLYVFPNINLHILFHNLYLTHNIIDIQSFWDYYQKNYINKIYNYNWMYQAYIIYDLSANKISEMFDIPYGAVKRSIENFNLKENKIKNQQERLNFIKEELQKIPSERGKGMLGSSNK